MINCFCGCGLQFAELGKNGGGASCLQSQDGGKNISHATVDIVLSFEVGVSEGVRFRSSDLGLPITVIDT